MNRRIASMFALASMAISLINPVAALACTGITLRASDGSVVFGRTMEWGSFDLESRLVIVPRNHAFVAETPDGKPGLSWKAKYGAVGIDAVGKDILLDGMNETGLSVGLFYHPGYADYQAYDPALAARSLAPTDVATYLLTTCRSIDDVRQALESARVVAVVEKALGIVAGVHFIATEPGGKSIVVEYLKGNLTIFDAPLGAITNAPSYDWHETNLRNYVNLSAVGLPDRKIGDLDFRPLGGGSGMIGLPGDFTPPSRFVRAVAFSKTARTSDTGEETMYEVFRILDNFNVPLGAAEGSAPRETQPMRSATQWTICKDTRSRTLYYHTQHNRRVRKLALDKLDFQSPNGLTRLPLDREHAQDIEEINPPAR